MKRKANKKIPRGTTPRDNGGGETTNHALIAGLLLFALVFGVFYPLTGGDFVNYDDDVYVTANYHVQRGLALKEAGWVFRNTEGANWHPLTWISHMMDYQFYGAKPWGHHLTSVVLHALNAALLFWMMRAMTGTMWRSLAVALLFGLHPLRVESVAWISERKDVLCGTFWLLTMWAYVCYAQGLKIKNAKSEIHYVLALGFFACGLMSKPMAVSLPFVLLLVDFWPLRRIARRENIEHPTANIGRRTGAEVNVGWKRAVVEKVPFFLLAGIVCVVTFLAQKGQGAVIEILPLGYRIENAVVAYARYTGKFFWPANLAVLYPHPMSWPFGKVLAAGLLLAGISGVLLAGRRLRPYGVTGWLWFLGTLVPVIGLVQVGSQSMADRYTYLPMIGLNIVVVWGAWELVRRLPNGKMAAATGAAAAGLVCAGLTEHQIGFWKDSGTLFSHAVAVTDNSYEARKALGDFAWSQGNGSEAVKLYQEAIAMYPGFEGAHLNLGAVYSQTGRASDAAEEFKRAIALKPDDASAYNDLGTVLGPERLDESMDLFRKAIQLDGNYADARKNLAVALDAKGRREEAIAEYRKVTELRPDADAHYLLGMDLGRLGHKDAAVSELKEALKLRPDHKEARRMLESLGINAKP